ncbi:tannase/feruloyl esterase family alpha/beta hydrolase [Pleomorphomonas koreensis]|uniref:tannase/feruloyl esterase family alpha/beta hydrolase n=1 Tax=Pleomorphomonas koreensis TaxID=257440 RepID=UPI0004274842|nr:tannase/feruloyl esterase family alpha/beta hydrolase [Pleomorphomonas koreensis]
MAATKLIAFCGQAEQRLCFTGCPDGGREAVLEALMKEIVGVAVAGFERLYLLRGIYHCVNGEGMGSVDFLKPLMACVEDGAAPDAVVTRTATDGGNSFGLPTAKKTGKPAGAPAAPAEPAMQRERPVYPYPALAKYVGGEPNRPRASSRAIRSMPIRRRPWAGEDFFRPYQPAE